MDTHMHRADVDEAMAGVDIYLCLRKQFLLPLGQPFCFVYQFRSFSVEHSGTSLTQHLSGITHLGHTSLDQS